VFDINPTVLCSPHRASIQSCIELLGSYLGKSHITIRLEPLLKEAFVSGDTTPLKAADLKKFVDQVSEESGIKIVYGDKSLERDDWVLDILTNKGWALRLSAALDYYKQHEPAKADLLMAFVEDIMKTKKYETDTELFQRALNLQERLIELMAGLRYLEKPHQKILIVSHGHVNQALLSDICKPKSMNGKGF
jgi:hypothetical protein